MLVQEKMKQEKTFVKSTPSAFISVIFALLAAGCTSLPNREVPHELGVKQVPGKSEGHPAEFVFCDMNGGAWSCEAATPKTPVSFVSVKHSDDKPITGIVRDSLKVATSDGGVSALDKQKQTSSSQRKTDSKKSPSQPENTKAVPAVPPVAVVYFDFDSSVITADAKLTLLAALDELSSKGVEIHGYTDNVGSEPYNNWLGLRRANKVKDFFETAKSTATQIEAYGHGLCCYAEPNGTAEQRAKNRRVEVYAVD